MGGKQVPTLRQAQQCGRVKPNKSPLPHLIIRSPLAIQNKQTIKNLEHIHVHSEMSSAEN